MNRQLQATPQPDMGKKVVNSNLGMSNIVPREAIRSTMVDTLTHMASVLENHCGPYAESCILTPQVHQVGEPIFTTDGINIINSIEYTNPLQEFVRSMVVYIGKRIDLAGSDGTTSSMLVVINALKNLIVDVDKTVSSRELTSAYAEFQKDTFEQLNHLVERLTDTAFGKDNMEDNLAYRQAMSSSKGDKELSKVIWELFSKTSSTSWDYVSFERKLMETDTRYTLNIDKSDYSAEITPITKSVMRGIDGMSCDKKKTKLMLFNQVLVANTQYWDAFMTILDEALKNNTHLTIIVKTTAPQDTKTIFENILRDAANNQIYVFMAHCDNEMYNDINSILLLSGRHPGDQYLQHTSPIDCTMEYDLGKLILTDLIPEEPVDGICGLMNKEKYESYNFTMSKLPEIIERTKQDTRDSLAGERARNLQKIFNKLYQTERPTIIVGGTAYDNHESIDVCIDALGAARNSLVSGATKGGMVSLLEAIKSSAYISEGKNLKDMISKAFINAIEDLHKAILVGSTATSIIEESVDGGGLDLIDVTTGMVTNKIIQPVTIDKEVIERFGEVALKFVKTCMVLIPHSVYRPDEIVKERLPSSFNAPAPISSYGDVTNSQE